MTDPRPSMDLVLMRTARLMAERSTCERARVGAILALEGRIISTGYNGAPRGARHCGPDDHPPVTATCAVAVHAEANAVAFAARNGVATEGATLYVTLAPCLPCSQLLINAGVNRVVYAEPYRLDDGITLLRTTLLVESFDVRTQAAPRRIDP